MNQEAAQAAVDQQLHWKDNRGVHDLLAQYGDANEGRVFRIWNQHWVALKGENRGTKVAMYFDDKIYMKIRNFDGASKALELMELMKEKDWIKSHQGLNHKATSSQLSKKIRCGWGSLSSPDLILTLQLLHMIVPTDSFELCPGCKNMKKSWDLDISPSLLVAISILSPINILEYHRLRHQYPSLSSILAHSCQKNLVWLG